VYKILILGASEFVTNALKRSLHEVECDFLFVDPDHHSVTGGVAERPDLAILDSTETRLDIPALCGALRQRHTNLLIMLLSPEGGSAPRECRVNLHLAAPFTARKLTNRVNKLLSMRRNQSLTVGNFTLEPEKRRIIHAGRIVRLTPKEYRLMEVLMLHAGSVLSRKIIMKEVWETDYLGDTRTLDVHMRWLREKIEADPAHPIYLKTARRIGYIFNPAEPGPRPVGDA
jgi:DNA-binding response OmpR family regulator